MPERNQQDDDKTTNSELESLAAIFRQQTDTSGKKRQKTDSRQTARQRGNSLSRAHHLASSSSGSRHRCAGHELPSQPVAVPDIHWLSRWRPVWGGSHLGWTAVLLFCLEPPVPGFQKKLKIKQPLDPGFLIWESRTPYPYPPVLGLKKWATIPAPRLPYLTCGRDDWLKPVESNRCQVNQAAAGDERHCYHGGYTTQGFAKVLPRFSPLTKTHLWHRGKFCNL